MKILFLGILKICPTVDMFYDLYIVRNFHQNNGGFGYDLRVFSSDLLQDAPFL